MLARACFLYCNHQDGNVCDLVSFSNEVTTGENCIISPTSLIPSSLCMSCKGHLTHYIFRRRYKYPAQSFGSRGQPLDHPRNLFSPFIPRRCRKLVDSSDTSSSHKLSVIPLDNKRRMSFRLKSSNTRV